MKNNLENVWRALKEIFGHNYYAIFAGILALLTFSFAVWFSNISLIVDIFMVSSISLSAKFKIIFSLIGGIGTNFSIISAFYTISISILFGIVIAMLLYSYRKKQAQVGGNLLTMGFGAISSGALGVGCAACGSFVVTSFLSFVGAGGALAVLPLKGGEFGILSIILLLALVFVISKKNFEPMVCEK